MPNTHQSDADSPSHLSPTSSNAAQPTWPAPRAPLPPHRLAKLANALGVSTPVPVTHAPHAFTLSPLSPTIPPSSTSPTFPDAFRRSPTPSFTSSQQQHTSGATTSKYLLHVIPPYHLPHDVDDYDTALAPPPTAGHQSQFRRGVLVPVYPSLQAQLGAIAREYSLPSTVGMILYLITAMTPSAANEPGPRLSEDIWKHIWIRVVKAEKDEAVTPHPRPLGLGFGVAGRSSPALLQDLAANQAQAQSLRALISPRRVETPQPLLSPSPSTSMYSSQSEHEADSPESATSVDPSSHSNSLPLPGLDSPALIPILAKVEFDIDKRKAGWYEAWVRSRRMNQAKRADSRQGGSVGGRAEESAEEGEEGAGMKRGPRDLRLVDRMERKKGIPGFLLTTEDEELGEPGEHEEHGETEYQQLEEDDVDEDGAAQPTDVQNGGHGEDPLQDVFGKDEEEWAEIRADKQVKRQTNPNVVELALDAGAVSDLPENLEVDDDARLPEHNDEEEVSELLKRSSKPALSVTIPTSPPAKRRSSPTTASTLKKHVPPPLNLLPSMPSKGELPVPEPLSAAPSTATSVSLAYLQAGATPLEAEHPTDHDEDDDQSEIEESEIQEAQVLTKARSPEEEKRAGAIFNDLDLGLDPSFGDSGEFDDNDPFDHRKSQLFMSAQLDEIEKTLAQFSPRPRLQSVDLTPEDIAHQRKQSVASVRSYRSSTRALSPPLPNESSPPRSKTPGSGVAWPAVPYSSLNAVDEDPEAPPSPPKFAFNGISTEPPKSPYLTRNRSGTAGSMSDETAARQRALAEERGLYPPLVPPTMTAARREDSPVIPMSPDPFGRYPSTPEPPSHDLRASQQYSDELSSSHPSSATLTMPHGRESAMSARSGLGLGVPMAMIDEGRPPSQTPSSRFSLDSVTSEEAAKAVKQPSSSNSIVSVKSLRRLWKRSDKRSSVSDHSPPPSGRASPNVPAVPEVQPAPAGRSRSKSITRPPPAPPLASMGPPIDFQHIPMARTNVIRNLRFDQESPYPIHPPRNAGPRTPSPPPMPSRPPSQQQHRTPDAHHQYVPGSTPGERGSIRKSILKSWKSATALANGRGSVSRPDSTTPRSSAEQPTETPKKRRPTMLDTAGGMRSSTAFGDIPPSPALPEHFVAGSRSSSRQSHNMQMGRPSVSSSGSAASPPRRSPMGTSPPSGNTLSAGPRPSFESFESRSSFDTSQFEMVSPPRGSLSYPYNNVDHSLTSAE